MNFGTAALKLGIVSFLTKEVKQRSKIFKIYSFTIIFGVISKSEGSIGYVDCYALCSLLTSRANKNLLRGQAQFSSNFVENIQSIPKA